MTGRKSFRRRAAEKLARVSEASKKRPYNEPSQTEEKAP
jgi:hypothetical protein